MKTCVQNGNKFSLPLTKRKACNFDHQSCLYSVRVFYMTGNIMIKLLTRYLKKSLYRNNNERKALLRNIL